MMKTNLLKRVMSFVLCVALAMTFVPISAAAASAGVTVAESAVMGSLADPGTAHTWETMMGTDADGNRYAGRVWVDKSVYMHGQTALLNGKGEASSAYQVALERDEAFQVIFSALGSTMTTTTTTSSMGPMDVVLVLDTSTSMDDTTDGVTRLQRVIEAANTLIDDLLQIKDVRIAVVTYNYDSETVLELAQYANGVTLKVNNYYNNGSDAGVVYAYDDNNNLLGKDSGYTMGTNLQAGIDRGFNILANEQNVAGRKPVAIVLTDGQANRAVRDEWYNIPNNTLTNNTGPGLALSTLLNAAYNKAKIQANYQKEAVVYSISVDLEEHSEAHALMNPGDATYGFNSNNSHSDIKDAYSYFNRWAAGNTVTFGNGNRGWTFDHNYPTPNGITLQDIVDNIIYVAPENYYDVSSAQLQAAFDQIYDELSSGVFNPISSSTTTDGATGVDNTPLIYVDFIGQYMEVKEIQAVSLFGASYGVRKNEDGTYTVAPGTGVNPTTGEDWSTSEDILISVQEQENGIQKLEIKINQEILPIILEQVISKTVGGVTTATITQFTYNPLRVFYTVGLRSEILLPTGEINVLKIQGYPYINDVDGTLSFYSNQFGVMNVADSQGVVTSGDAHVGFQPSSANRYYYHQTNQAIFSAVSATDGSAIDWNADAYGVRWEEGKYNLTYLSYADYQTMSDNDEVYTYVSYYRPTESQTDAADAAEQVTYLVYTNWGYLKESVAFYDNYVGVYINYDAVNGYVAGAEGYAPEVAQVEAMLAAYMQANPNADIKAVLGVGSLRTSRLHNMESEKTANPTETASLRYDPDYTYETAEQHNDNDVVVWLGNNGRLTVAIDTGIALTKAVTEAIGNADDTYALTVTVPADVAATPVVMDAQGNDITATTSNYVDNVLTVNLKADETVYISGIPGGTVCLIGENVPDDADYYVASQTYTVTIPTISQVLDATAPVAQYVPATVTNAPNEYGNLFITKEIASDHNIPARILAQAFEITVHVGTALAGKSFTVVDSAHAEPYTVTVDANGNMVFTILATQTIEILALPEGTVVTVTETAPASIFSVSYRTRNHSGVDSDTDNSLVIPADGNATAVVVNHYTPNATSVQLDIAGTKDFTIEGNHNGGAFTFQVQKWNGTAWEDIPGMTAQTVYAANESGVKTFQIEDVLSGVVFTEVGSHAYQVLEVVGDVENVTYDRTLYTFTVTVTDNGGQLVATITDMHNATITDGDYEVTFYNTYHTASVSVDIQKKVENLSGDPDISKAGFAFLAAQTDAQWNPLTGQQASSMTVYTDAAGHARMAATYTTAGTYYYVLTEVNQAAPGWSYSVAAYHITVVVTEENGNLVAALIIEAVSGTTAVGEQAVVGADGTAGTVSFVNTYDPENATINLDGMVTKELTGKTLESGAFTFYVCQDGTVEAVRNGTMKPVLVGTNDWNGNVQFVDFAEELIFTQAGKYEYDIIEMIPAEAVYDAATGKYVLGGMYYDSTIYDLVVEVTNDSATGKLVATCYFEDAVGQVVTFRNKYQTTATSYTLGGWKDLIGRAVRAGEFAFALYEGDTWLETVTNKGDGSFTFQEITYTEAGVYTYTIKEISGDVAGVDYTGVAAPITVVVTVTDNNGVLTASASIANSNIRFENIYTAAPAKITFQGAKTLVGGNLADGSFTFRLFRTNASFDITEASAALIATAQNANGLFDLGVETFHTPGTYFYVIVEDAAAEPMEEIVYDSTIHRFTVQVSDRGDGQLRAVVKNVNTGETSQATAMAVVDVSFVNATFEEATEKEVYHSSEPAVQIDGQKVNAGDILTYFITYTNYTGADVVVDIVDTIPQYTSYVEGSASHNGTYAGTHINWVLNVARGESVTVSFDVRVDQTHAIIANTAVVYDGVNSYYTNEVINHTVENNTKKDVVAPGDVTISMDGQKVYEGDELIYQIHYTNTTDTPVDITITDRIPAYTTYAEGSADNGGIYGDGVVTWNITDVPAWGSVTVSFKVIVNNNIGAQTITNEATVVEGENTYVTNPVSNYTVEDEVSKDVSNVHTPDTSIDGAIVNYGDTLQYTITYTNSAKETATITITDRIPQYTSYVEGSADNGGIYADGVITWVLDVAPGETVTVTFQVIVDYALEAVITNQAAIQEGNNSYTTNEVTNKIYEEKNPSTGDNAQHLLWMALAVVSGAVLVTLAIVEKKRKAT